MSKTIKLFITPEHAAWYASCGKRLRVIGVNLYEMEVGE